MKFRHTNLKTIALIIGVSASNFGCAGFETNKNGQLTEVPYNQDIFKLSELAITAYKAARWEEAARLYQQLTRRVPSDAYIWFRLANTYVQKGDFDQAIDAYASSIERDSEQPKSWFNLSTTYMLNAKVAMLESWENLRTDDPARKLINQRVAAIDNLLNEEINPIRVVR